ncbi:MAG: MOSC domain-containing protein, partial [Chloroflexota bacterium]
IAPVRSLGLQHPDTVDVTEHGVVEDRRFFLIDDTDRLIDRTVVGELVQIAAETDAGATRLRLAFPDGTVMDEPVKLGEPVDVPIYDRRGVGHVVEGPWAAALSAFTERTIRLIRCDDPAGTRLGNPASLITDGSLRELAVHASVDGVDGRRFRMLMELSGGAAHEEDTWVDRRIAVGGAILRVTKPVPRCAITTQDPDTGVRDMDTLRTIISYRGLRDGKKVDFGVLADVVQPGRIRVGDDVTVLDPAPTA